MKKYFSLFIKFLAITGLSVSLAACGTGKSEETPKESAGDSPAAEAVSKLTDAGTSKAVGVKLDDYLVESDSTKGYTIELTEDGAGNLNFGEDNKGPITSWDNSGSFTMKAGVSDFTGTLKDGILYLDLGDGIVICFAQDNADRSNLNVISMDEYKKLKDTVVSDVSAVAGEYHIYAVERDGVCIAIPEGEMEFTIQLKEDNTATVTVDGETEALTWKLDGDTLTLFDGAGNISGGEYKITVKDGIITFFIAGENGESDIYEYLVTKDADVSGLHAVDPSTLEN